ncbi:MAG: translocation/assembly module TamB domain-containing protein [Iphinoe sp. HA4291-MV1]|jgi:translocation and assembly module TamB|nr:translocation/assembly module TamB domain-containing protein [Iphinoe sp. HA4291-MV1]
MTKACNRDHHSQSPYLYKKHPWLLILSRSGIALGGILLVGMTGGAWRLWNFIHKDLVPLAQSNLTTTLNRPVRLGKVKQLSLTGVKFGASAIPATPTDPDRVTVEVVEVGFDPLKLLFNRRLKLDVTLVNPDVYIEQDEQGRWITTTVTPSRQKGLIKTNLDNLRFRNAKLTLVPQGTRGQGAMGKRQGAMGKGQWARGKGQCSIPDSQFPIPNSQFPIPNSQLSIPNAQCPMPNAHSSPVAFSQINGTAQLLENYKLVKFNLGGQPNNGGNLSIQGDFRPKTQEINLQLLRGQNLLAADISRIVKLPVELQTGRVQGELKILNLQLKQKQQNPLIFGHADLQGVQLQIKRIPQTFINSQGKLRFQGTQTQLENVSASYGKISLIANGTIDSKAGYKLVGRVNLVNVASAWETLKVKLPVPTIGEVKADLQLVGSITNPIFSGTVATIKSAKIDKVDFNSVRTQFEFSPAASVITFKNILGKATVGGEMTGAGTIRFVNKIPQLNFNVKAKNVPGDAIASIYNTKPAFQIGTVSGTAQLTGTDENVQTVVQWQAPQATYPGSGETIIAPDKTVSFRNIALSVAGGTVQVAGSWANQRWQAIADASQVQVQRFVNPNQLKNVSLDDARFNGRLTLSGTSAPFKIATIRTDNNTKVKLAGGTVAISNIQFGEQSFSAQLVADGVQLGRLLKQAPSTLQGPLSGKFQVSGNTNAFNLKTLRAIGTGRLLIGGGAITASNIQVAEGLYKAQLNANNVALQQLAQLPKQFQGRLTGQFNVAGSVESFKPSSVVAKGQARVNFESGTATASNIELANGRYQMQLQANNVPLQRLTQIPQQFYGKVTGQFNVAGLADSPGPQTMKATGQARLNVANGTVTASNIQVADGRYQAVVDASGVELKRLSQQLQGQFGGKLQVVGKVGTFNISNVRASGQVQFSQGIGGIEQPLTAVVGWDGQKLLVERATSPDLNANGYILVNDSGTNIPEIAEINLNVQAQNFNLQKLPMRLPKTVALAGKADFGGKISGKLPVPNIQGQLRLRNLVVNRLPFESVLTGNIQLLQERGLNLDIAGKRDRIAVNADAKSRPNSFLVKWQDALASGQTQGDNLAMKVENFPLAILNLTPPPNTHLGKGVIAGFLTGDFQVNQKTFATLGNVAIAKPQVGRIKGDRLNAQFRYSEGQASITNGEFVKGVSRYALAGTLTQTPKGPQIKGKLNVTQGQVQDVLTALQIYEFQDVQRGLSQPSNGTAADLSSIKSVKFADQPLLTQLQRFVEIESLLAQEKQQSRAASLIPDLADLNGTFNGEVSIDTATANGLDVSFNLNGQNFVWGRVNQPEQLYKAERVIAQGRFENGVLRLLPLQVESKNQLIAFTGNIGGTEQSGQLRVINFPLQVLNNFVKLPVGLTGYLNGTAALAGSINNPQAKGELQITEGTLNQKGVESAIASFNYINGRLDFGSHVVVSGSEPVKIAGSIPYQLPFASVKPDNDKISLDMKVQNEGLAVLNLLTNQFAFEKGEGQIDLMVRGTTQQPILDGIATVKDATFSSQALPEKLTDITAKVQFDLDRIIVQNLQGKYNNKGKVEAKGEIPVVSQGTKIDNPLNITLDQLALKLKGLYQGDVSGNLQITGSALDPMVGGQLQLDNGQVLLAQSPNATTPANSNNIDVRLKQAKQNSRKVGNTTTKFNHLQLKLGKNVEITRPPILSFRATGSLIVNGSFGEPIPEGTIRLREGSVNLFTTRFNLVRGYKHKAIFRANQPRDPDLDIQLFAKVLDVLQNTDLNKPNITGLAALENVRVEARVQGAASKLDESLELTSSPARTETEIVALLGGGFVNPQEQNNDTNLRLINIAGSAVLNNLQEPLNQIGTVLGLSELRLFPTILSNTLEAGKEAGRTSSSLELAAEAGVDLTRRISISTLKILTTNDPFQWGINYRINDTVRVRATTNLLDDNRAVVEYHKRF